MSTSPTRGRRVALVAGSVGLVAGLGLGVNGLASAASTTPPRRRPAPPTSPVTVRAATTVPGEVITVRGTVPADSSRPSPARS